jgi:hypothetical protein
MNVPGAAAVPCSFAAMSAQGARGIAVAGEAIVDFVLEPGGGTTPRLGGGAFNAARAVGGCDLRARPRGGRGASARREGGCGVVLRMISAAQPGERRC